MMRNSYAMRCVIMFSWLDCFCLSVQNYKQMDARVNTANVSCTRLFVEYMTKSFVGVIGLIAVPGAIDDIAQIL